LWYETEQGLVDGMFQGLSICFPVAFVVLLFATSNAIVSVLATITIGLIVSVVLGICQLVGWTLGIAETIAAVIVIGFSVDYCVHLAHMYTVAHEDCGLHSRKDRTEYALVKMGATVLAGAVTTSGAGVFLLFCQMLFFFKMAIMIVCTIGFSFLFAIGFFMNFVLIAGPAGDFMDLKWFTALCMGNAETTPTVTNNTVKNGATEGPATSSARSKETKADPTAIEEI